MNDMKYIVAGIDVLIFSRHLTHFDMARNAGYSEDDIDGAGFVSFNMYGNPHCYGRAESLHDKASRGEADAKMVANQMRDPGGCAMTAEEYHKGDSAAARNWWGLIEHISEFTKIEGSLEAVKEWLSHLRYTD